MPTNALPKSAALTSVVTPANPRVDVERFRADLREGGVEEMLTMLLETFVQDCPGRLADLEQAVNEGNPKKIESAAHAFKSGAGTVRATSLAEALRELEAAGRNSNLADVTKLVERIRIECAAALRELEMVPRRAGV